MSAVIEPLSFKSFTNKRKTNIFLDENDSCLDPSGLPGRCINVRDCEPLMKIYEKAIVTHDESQFIEQSRCGVSAEKKAWVSVHKAPMVHGTKLSGIK